MKDAINPPHYKQGSIEVIEILKDQLSTNEFRGFCKGLILKYIFRADHKNGVEDYKKAQWYLNVMISEMEKGEQK